MTDEIMELDYDDFIALSQEKFKDHPSVRKINEKHPEPSNFQFKEVSPESVHSIISHLDPHKARKGYSCQSSLFKLCEEMRHALDHSEMSAMILMDLSKAFDCLPHNLMVAKLTAYGMSPSAIKLLINYLRHYQQRVKIGSEFSEWMTILKGVPQSSILGPCFFNLF